MPTGWTAGRFRFRWRRCRMRWSGVAAAAATLASTGCAIACAESSNAILRAKKPPMRTDLFDFEVRPEPIALPPATPRDSARMLVMQGSDLRDQLVSDLPAWLRPGDQLVVNDTRVIA